MDNEERLLRMLAERERTIPKGLAEAAAALQRKGWIRLTYHLKPALIFTLTASGRNECRRLGIEAQR